MFARVLALTLLSLFPFHIPENVVGLGRKKKNCFQVFCLWNPGLQGGVMRKKNGGPLFFFLAHRFASHALL